MALLARRARGDHGPDKWAEQFPRYEGAADPSLTPWALFERWIAKAKPVFLRPQGDFRATNGDSCGDRPQLQRYRLDDRKASR
jgi:hypothetical protein